MLLSNHLDWENWKFVWLHFQVLTKELHNNNVYYF